jgi:hypothetical protein
MKGPMNANLEKMKACLRATAACLGKTEGRIETGQESREAEIKTALEEMKGTESEAIQERIEASAEHQEAPNENATLETIGALEDGFAFSAATAEKDRGLRRSSV